MNEFGQRVLVVIDIAQPLTLLIVFTVGLLVGIVLTRRRAVAYRKDRA